VTHVPKSPRTPVVIDKGSIQSVAHSQLADSTPGIVLAVNWSFAWQPRELAAKNSGKLFTSLGASLEALETTERSSPVRVRENEGRQASICCSCGLYCDIDVEGFSLTR